MNKGVFIGVSLLVLLVLGYMYTSSGSSVTINKEDMKQASKVIVSQLEQEAREAIPLQLQANVDGMGLDDTVRGEVLSILKQDVISSDLGNVGSTSGMLGTSLLGTTDPEPGSREYNTITFAKLMELSGIGQQTWNIQSLPEVPEESLLAMMIYSTERGLPRQAKVHAEVITYKKLLQLGQTIDLDLSEFSPNASLITPSDIPMASMEVEKLREFLAAFLFSPFNRTSYTTMVNALRNIIEQIDNEATQAELEASLAAQEAATAAARANAAPGTTLYNEVTNEMLRSIAGNDFPLGSDRDLPRLDLSVLEELLSYANRRSAWKESIRFAKAIAYKKVLIIGEEEGLDLRQYAPNLNSFSTTSIDFSEVSIDSRNKFLAAFDADHDIPTPFTKTDVIDEIKRSLAEDGEFIDVDSELYREETRSHIMSNIFGDGSVDFDFLLVNGEFKHDLHVDVLLQIYDYALSREDSVLAGKAMDALEKKKLLAVGVEIGIDFSVVEVTSVDLKSLSVANLVKLENVLRTRMDKSSSLGQFLTELVVVKDNKAQEAVVSQNLAEEAETEAQEQAQEQAQQEAEEARVPVDNTIQQLVENKPEQPTQQPIQQEESKPEEPTQQPTQREESKPEKPSQQPTQREESKPEKPSQQPTQQAPEVTEAINNIRSDKTGRVGVEMRQNDNGSVFVDLSVPSDITPSDSDKVTLFFTSESWSKLSVYQTVFSKIKSAKSLEGLTTEEINAISSSGVIFNDISKSYVRQMTIKVNDRVGSL